ncbi:hypothetical protein ES703_62195 [subsurface metagenome]
MAGQQCVLPEKAVAIAHNLQDTATEGMTLLLDICLEQVHDNFLLLEPICVGDAHLLGQFNQLFFIFLFQFVNVHDVTSLPTLSPYLEGRICFLSFYVTFVVKPVSSQQGSG